MAASASASSFVVHHTQQISMAAVAGDAENVNKQEISLSLSLSLKQALCFVRERDFY